MEERFAYVIRLVKEGYMLPHTRVFVDQHVADKYFDQDLRYYTDKGWCVDDEKDPCGDNLARKATLVKRQDGKYESMSLLMEIYEIIKK